jgi:hypothetical protein
LENGKGDVVKKLWMLLLLMSVAFLLAGSVACGGDDDDDSGDSGGSDATVEAGDDEGGDDEATDEPADDDDSRGDDGDGDYYNQLEALFDSADQDTNAIAQQYGGPYDDTADEIAQTTSALEETSAVMRDLIDSMSDLDIPVEAQDAHDNYVGSLGSAASLFAVAAADIGDVSTAEELTAFQDDLGPDLSAAVDANEEDCLALQDLADEADSGADLGCSVQD